MGRTVKTTVLILATAFMVLHAPQVLAQVAGASKVTSFFSWILSLVQVAGYSLFTIALMMLGYKVTYVEGFKISDGKGIVIGGLIFGLAGVIAMYFTS